MSLEDLDRWKDRLLSSSTATRRDAIKELATAEAPHGLREWLHETALANGEPGWLDAATALWVVYRDPAPAVEGLAVELFEACTAPDRAGDVLSLIRLLGTHGTALVPLIYRACACQELVAHFGGMGGLVFALFDAGGAPFEEVEALLGQENIREPVLFALLELQPEVPIELTPLVARLEGLLREGNANSMTLAACLLWRITRSPPAFLFDLGPNDIELTSVGLCGHLGHVLLEVLAVTPRATAPLRHLIPKWRAVEGLRCVDSLVPRLLALGAPGRAVLFDLITPDDSPLLEDLFSQAAAHPDAAVLFLAAAWQVVARAGNDGDEAPSSAFLAAAYKVLFAHQAPEQLDLSLFLRLFPRAPGNCDDLAARLAPLVRTNPFALGAVLAELERLCARYAESRDAVPDIALGALARLAWAAEGRTLLRLLTDTRLTDAALERLAWAAPTGAAWLGRDDGPRYLAGILASPQAGARARLPRLLTFYPGLADRAWPDLVAALTARDADTRQAVLPLFLDLEADLDRVAAELTLLLADPEADTGAVELALTLVGHGPAPRAEALLGVWRQVEYAACRGNASSYYRLRFHARLDGAPDDVRARLRQLTYPDACTDEAADPWFGELLTTDWAIDYPRIPAAITSDPWSGEMLTGVVLHRGAAAYPVLKVPLIKAYRHVAGGGLSDSKQAVEAAFGGVMIHDTPEDRRTALRTLYPGAIPPRFAELLEHPAAWFRWAGLVVIALWGPGSAAVRPSVVRRLTDPAPRVAEQARAAVAAIDGERE